MSFGMLRNQALIKRLPGCPFSRVIGCISIALFAVVASGLFAKVSAQEPTSYTFVGTHFPLILEQNEDGTLFGLGKDILDEIAADTGLSFDVMFLPWARAIKMVKDGSADGIIGLYEVERRKSFLDYCYPPFRDDHMSIITRRDAAVPWDGSFSSLIGHEVIAIRHWGYGDDFIAYKDNLNIQTANDLKAALGMLMKGRGDAMIANIQSVLYEMKKMNIKSGIEFLTPPVTTVRNHFAFSKARNDSQFQELFTSAYHRLLDSGRLTEITKKHTLPQE